MLTAVPLFLTCLTDMSTNSFQYNVFDATVIQMSGLASYKTSFNLPFSTQENALPSQKYNIW